MTAFVKALTIRAWVAAIWPRLLWRRLAGRPAAARCWIFESSTAALAIARWTGWLLGTRVEPLRFDLYDVRDEQGLWLRLRIVYQDLTPVHAAMRQDPLFREAALAGEGNRFAGYLAKALTLTGFGERDALWRLLLAVQICRWWTRRNAPGSGQPILFAGRRPWAEPVARYAADAGVELVFVQASFNARVWLRSRLPYRLRAWARKITACRGTAVPMLATRSKGPCVAVEYGGQANLEHPERFSDLFFWDPSAIAADELLLCARSPKPVEDARTIAQLSARGFRIARMDALLTWRTPQAKLPGSAPCAPQRRCESEWLREQRTDYEIAYQSWRAFFEAHGVKIYTTWFKYDREHCAMADALQDLGGVTAMHQRAYELLPSMQTIVATDVFFGFSTAAAEIERRSGSRIPYHVTTGYLGDHRAALLNEYAGALRASLQQCGARRVLALADEGTADWTPWYPDHASMRRYYAFLLEQVLKEPWFGLVIKPKVASTLRRRLGPVAERLAQAEATGRCRVVEGHYPPAAAALAADVMVHAHLFAATAGIESALAGVPTLVVDREGWSISPLSRLGGRVVFTDWAALWSVCREHWRRAEGVPGFGDWSPMLHEFDPFRDGRARERMGVYLQWLCEGFKTGLDRETVLADAAERYAERWGRQYVASVNTAVSQADAMLVGQP